MRHDKHGTADELLKIRYYLQLRAWLGLRKGVMRNARMLAGHDDLGPVLGMLAVTETLLNGPTQPTFRPLEPDGFLSNVSDVWDRTF